MDLFERLGQAARRQNTEGESPAFITPLSIIPSFR